jgi:hypothetical protein
MALSAPAMISSRWYYRAELYSADKRAPPLAHRYVTRLLSQRRCQQPSGGRRACGAPKAAARQRRLWWWSSRRRCSSGGGSSCGSGSGGRPCSSASRQVAGQRPFCGCENLSRRPLTGIPPPATLQSGSLPLCSYRRGAQGRPTTPDSVLPQKESRPRCSTLRCCADARRVSGRQPGAAQDSRAARGPEGSVGDQRLAARAPHSGAVFVPVPIRLLLDALLTRVF